MCAPGRISPCTKPLQANSPFSKKKQLWENVPMTYPLMNTFNISKMLKNWNKAILKSQRVRATGISLRMHDPWKTPRFYKWHLLHTKAWANKGRTKQTQNTENITCKGTHVWPDLWQKSQLGLLFVGSVKPRGGKRSSTVIFNILKARDRTSLFQVIGITKATNRSRGPWGHPTQQLPHSSAYEPFTAFSTLGLLLPLPPGLQPGRLFPWVVIYFFWSTLVLHLLSARHCSKCFASKNALNPHNNYLRHALHHSCFTWGAYARKGSTIYPKSNS